MEGLSIELQSWLSKELIDAKLTPTDTSLSIYCFKATRCDTIIICFPCQLLSLTVCVPTHYISLYQSTFCDLC